MAALSRRRVLRLAMVPAALASAETDDLAPSVSRIYIGTEGNLVYVPDEHGNAILDFSRAGYSGGGMLVPAVPVRETIWQVAGENNANYSGGH